MTNPRHRHLPMPGTRLKHDPIIPLTNAIHDFRSIQLTKIKRERIIFHLSQDSANEPLRSGSQPAQLPPHLIIEGDLEAHY